ncbi:MAG: shikimate kinase AroK [Chloroflexi bacterium]|nr:shikimate kinase AroK [Chloroflexota bacterium]
MSGRRPVDRVFLVGMSGAGKSSVARAAATRLGWTAWDSDVEIAARDGRSIPQIFAQDGEPAFRALERDVVDELSAQPRAAGALGGGAMADATTRERLLARGLVAWLQVSPDVAAARLADGLADEPRPMLGDDPRRRLADLIAAREAAYRQAHVHVDTDQRSVAEVAEALAAEVRAAMACRPA